MIARSGFGPSLGPLEHAKDLDAFGPHAVREYVGRARDNKLTGIWYATGTPGRGVISKELHSVGEPLRDFGCCRRTVASDVGSYGLEVFDRSVEPCNSHRGGFPSCAVPQLASQASTSSWPTKRASRRFALLTVSRIARVCHSLRAM